MGHDNLYYKFYEELEEKNDISKNNLLNIILYAVVFINHQQKK